MRTCLLHIWAKIKYVHMIGMGFVAHAALASLGQTFAAIFIGCCIAVTIDSSEGLPERGTRCTRQIGSWLNHITCQSGSPDIFLHSERTVRNHKCRYLHGIDTIVFTTHCPAKQFKLWASSPIWLDLIYMPMLFIQLVSTASNASRLKEEHGKISSEITLAWQDVGFWMHCCYSLSSGMVLKKNLSCVTNVTNISITQLPLRSPSVSPSSKPSSLL